MVKSKAFWVGFFVGYALLLFVPQANVLGYLGGGKGKGRNG